ncbi:MAG: putative ABC transporter permease, partial [Clostridiales bacterium]|nr:putative ABC transporter permease [Clostridiales bacterium]
MNGFWDLVLFFAIYSFLGWLMETIFASINERKFINRGFLNGFFCPIYGFGAILIVQFSKGITFVFKDYSASLLISIVFSTILVTVLELSLIHI